VRISSIRDAAAALRGRRTDLGLSQAELARRAGVSRKWISEFERGHLSAEIGLVLRVLDVLGLAFEVVRNDLPAASADDSIPDLDALLSEQRER